MIKAIHVNKGLQLDPGKAMSQLPRHLHPELPLSPPSLLAASQVEMLPSSTRDAVSPSTSNSSNDNNNSFISR